MSAFITIPPGTTVYLCQLCKRALEKQFKNPPQRTAQAKNCTYCPTPYNEASWIATVPCRKGKAHESR